MAVLALSLAVVAAVTPAAQARRGHSTRVIPISLVDEKITVKGKVEETLVFRPNQVVATDGDGLKFCNKSGVFWSLFSYTKYNKFGKPKGLRIAPGACTTVTVHNPTDEKLAVKYFDELHSLAKLTVTVSPKANASIFLPPGVSEAQIVPAPFALDGSVKVTVSGEITSIPKVGPSKGKKACYDAFYYTTDCSNWKGPGKSYFIVAGPPDCHAATCMTRGLGGMIVPAVFPEFSANHTYKLTLKGKGEGSFWAYPFKGGGPATWGGGFTLDFG